MTNIPAPLLSIEEVENIKSRKPFKGTWLLGYLTRGNSYMIASNGRQSDSGKPRDLILVLAGDIGQGRIIPVYIAVNPRLFDEVFAIFSEV